ncbi:hypothetical protein XA68_13461 [Ophiocordyceps unilateralis]|uniref:Uncharacterized protein n=1 Tax=Ophiocordyceps unilateralis TaxID=268505 RepID=A0A2A9PC70_OPHUN|nr:hypothetical protein XA68_13461 [Ophiocordyceps unilateralis]
MGNTLSSEAPAKAPQKLYKSRVPYHQYDLPTNLTPPPDFAACCEADTRYRHCYLAASRPLLHLNLPSPSHDGAWDSYLSSPVSAAAAHRLSWQRFEAIDCVKLAQLQEPLVTSAADPDASTKSSLKRRLSRANSVVCQTGAGVRSLVRSRSVQSNGYPARDLHQHPAIVMDPHQQSLQSSLLRRRQNSCPIHMTLSALESNPSSQTQDSDSQLSSQGSPARSSFIPVRQRSLYLTPGVATRTVRDSPSSSTKPFVQVGPSIAEAKDSYDSDRRPDFTSLMPSSSGLESQHRPVTPCEANYRQLGGIKFGTLRITNGSPVPSPSAESDDEALRRLAQPPSPTAKDRLVANSPVASVEASEVSTRDSSSTDHAGHGVGKAMPSLPGSPVIDRQLSPRAGTTISQKRSAEVEFTSPEVLDVRDDPHAKSHGIRDKLPENRLQVRQLLQFQLLDPINPIRRHVEVIMEEPGRVTRWKGSQSTRSAISSMSREVMRRLSSRSSKSLKSLPPDYRQTPVQDGTCWPAGADFVANPEAVQETVFGSPDRKQEKQGRLLRLLSGGRKQANADVYLPSYSVPDCAPAVPVNLREKLHTRIGHMSTVPKKDLFRLDPSHQPLQTILSVESLPLEGDNMEEGNVVDDGNNETWCEAELPREPTPPPPPAKSPRFSPPKVSAASLSPRMLIRRKPVGSGPKTPDKPPKTPAKPLKSPVGRSPLATTDAAAEPPAYQNEGHSLSSHASLPNMTASFRTRPLPPVPPQPSARTVKTARDLLPSQAVSTTSDAQEGRRETLGRYRWMPAQTKNSETVSVSAQPQPRRLGPSATCRPPHLRQYYDDQGQQYRVLHSYNSPSYRNVPIWG